MSTMRIGFVPYLIVLAGSVACGVVACVGDDPVAVTAPADDAGGTAETGSGLDSATPDSGGADTSTTEDTGTEGGGPFSPTSLGNDLALWLVAGKGVTEAAGVASWVDQSPQPLTFAPLNPNIRPALEKGVLVGQDVINFSVKNMAMTVAHSPK